MDCTKRNKYSLLNLLVCMEFRTVTDFQNLWLVILVSLSSILFTNVSVQSINSTKTK